MPCNVSVYQSKECPVSGLVCLVPITYPQSPYARKEYEEKKKKKKTREVITRDYPNPDGADHAASASGFPAPLSNSQVHEPNPISHNPSRPSIPQEIHVNPVGGQIKDIDKKKRKES